MILLNLVQFLKLLQLPLRLENAVANKSTNYYYERGKLNVQGHIINEAESKKTYEWLSVQGNFKIQLKHRTTKIAFDLGLTKLKNTIRRF